MKKILVILLASLFLIGCQSNDKPEDDQTEHDNDVEQVGESEEPDQTDQDDVEAEDIPETDEGSNDGATDEDKPSEPEASKDDKTDDADETEGSDEATGYSADDAIVLVQEFIQGTGSDIGLNYSVDGTDDQGNYRIQVFEVVDHGEGESHTATYGWYLVNPETGEITDMFAQ